MTEEQTQPIHQIDANTELEVVIGIEVHAQLKTKTKLFGSSSTKFGQKPNANVDPVCLGLPGALPVLNKDSVQMAVVAGLALNCEIKRTSVFSRKNYFYPDLPKGYQISQFDLPICEHGKLTISVDDQEKEIGITRIHMEEDAGKLNHQGADSIAGSTHSLVDLNRAGTPLIEIVSEPDIRSADEAKAYVEKLKTILQHMNICDGNMEEGSLRADVNISLKPKGHETFGTRTEVKNLNSFRSLYRSIHVEMERQEEILRSGGVVIQETRNYDDNKQVTTSLRSKEDAHDYRYFPEPDLLPLVLTEDYIQKIKDTLPDLPEDKVKKYQDQYGLTDFDCKVLIGDVEIDHYFQACLKNAKDCEPKDICKWVIGDLNAFLKDTDQNFKTTKATPEKLAQIVNLIKKGDISGKIAKQVLEHVINTGDDPNDHIKKAGLAQISDTSALQGIVDNILDQNPDVIEKVKSGKTKSADFLMGQVMKETRGQAKPDLVRQLILETIEKR